MGGREVAKQVTRIKSQTWKIGGERDDELSCRDERVDECMGPEIKVICHRTLNASMPYVTCAMFRTLRIKRWTAREFIMWVTLDGEG